MRKDIERLKTLFAARTEVEKLLDDALRVHRSECTNQFVACTYMYIHVVGKLSKQWKDNEEIEKVGLAYFCVYANAPTNRQHLKEIKYC